MTSPARQRDRFPIPPYSSEFPAPVFKLKLLAFDSPLSPLFVALPPVYPLSPLSTAFTHADGGVGVDFHFFPSPFGVERLLTTRCSLFRLLYFQQLTNPSAPQCSPIDFQLLSSQPFTNPSFRNSFVLSSIQNAGGVTPPPTSKRPPAASDPHPFGDPLPLRRSAPSSTSPSQSLKTRRIISRHPSQEPTTWLSPKRANRRNPPASPTANRNRLHPN